MNDSIKPFTALAPVTWTGLFFIVLIWSAINPKDYLTWALEVAPAIIGFIILAATRKKSPLTLLSYCLILIHCWILFIGGHYTYAEVPLFDTIKETFDHARNNYDKVGHFAQGFVPAILCREVVIRLNVFNKKTFINFFTICFCLAFSAFYELIEWWVALLTGDSAEAFLGTQGYIWDTQSDMAWALIGVCSALILLSHTHNKQLQKFHIAKQNNWKN